MLIHSRTDITTWIHDVRPDVVGAGLDAELRDAIQAADHPPFGTDWSEWLAEHVPALVDLIADETL